jgi:RHS repeat-associated protein
VSRFWRKPPSFSWERGVPGTQYLIIRHRGLNQLTTAGATALGYDGRGNLVSSGTTTYSYTSENRLATQTSAAPSVALAYDTTGRLSAVGQGSITTNFDYAGSTLIAERAAVSDAVLRRYVHGPGTDEPLVWYEGAGTTDRRWLHTDERGSVIAVSNSVGTVTAINKYDEYGIPLSTNVGRFGFTGQTFVPEIGLWYYKARMYSPTLGRFMQTDPIGYKDGINWYDYVDGDPVNRSDPTGLAHVEANTCSRLGGSSCSGTYSVGAPSSDNSRPGKAVPGVSTKSGIPPGAGAKSKDQAEKIARRIGDEEIARTYRITRGYKLGGHNDLFDAERHARWVYRMSMEIGSGWAGVFATGHEFGEIFSQPFIEMRMDLSNNSLGLKAAVDGLGMPTMSNPGLVYILNDRLVGGR